MINNDFSIISSMKENGIFSIIIFARFVLNAT